MIVFALRIRRRLVRVAALLGCATPLAVIGSIAQAQSAAGACSRTIEAPLAPVGLSVILAADGAASGVYPDLLHSVERRSGCQFHFSAVPRARQELLFENGQADILIPASRSPRRDEVGEFVPLIASRATIIGLRGERLPLQSLRELAEQRQWRVALVRGFDYGDEYQQISRELARQNRLSLQVDATSVARMLLSGQADLTIMAPSILLGAIANEARIQPLQERLRIEPVDELPWSESGAYLSRNSLTESDRQRLREALEQGARSGSVWRSFQKYYPAGSLDQSIRPR